MNRILKIVLIVFLVISAILLIMAISGYRMIMGALPVTKGDLTVPELQSKVCVYRDGFHIPHIFAQNEHDLFFAQGYITAQDRLWQMDLWRRYAKGQLSEIFGPFTTKSDSMMRTIGINRIVERIEPGLSPTSRRVMQAYTDGINAFIRQNKKHLPVEFKMLNYQPASWKITDCLAVLRLVGWQMSVGWTIEPVMGALIDNLGLEKVQQLFSFHAEDATVFQFDEKKQASIFYCEFAERFNPSPFPKPDFSSNCWVVSGKRSATGKPILANDPHLAFLNPSFWYEIHLTGTGFNVAGFSIPGLPLVAVGTNEHVAWGVTNLLADDIDFYEEKLDTDNGSRYLSGSQYRTMETIKDKIGVRDQPPIDFKIRTTYHGPIVSDILQHPMPDKAVSLRWIGQEISDECLSFYKLNLASDWKSFREALRYFKIPPQNFLYADRNGNIGYQAAGKIPIQNRAAHFIPKPGQNPENDWKGFISFDRLPSIKNPKEGILASANDGKKFKYGRSEILNYTDLPFRIDRIEQLLSEKSELSVMDMKKIQGDIQSDYALNVLKQVLPYLDDFTTGEPLVQRAAAMLSRWDGQLKAGSAEAMIFEQFLLRLFENIFKDELTDSLYNSWLDLYTIPWASLLREVSNPHSSWADNITTSDKRETLKEIIRISFENAVEQIKKDQGEDILNWSWGKVHTLLFEHPLGQIPLMDKIFNIGPFHMGGSAMTLNRMGFSLTKPYKITWGTSGRIIIDLSDLNNTISVLPTGQSGQPMDGHYSDQTQLFIQNLYHPNLMDTTRIAHAGWECLKMKPEEK